MSNPEKCHILPWRNEEWAGPSCKDEGCILPYAHWGNSDGNSHIGINNKGEYIEWGDENCDCCAPEDPERCFYWGVIEQSEVEKRIQEELNKA